jgi:tRNA(fMet)-specific endonuclease VapC
MTYLLDSNIWIKLLQARDLGLVDRFARMETSEIASCAPVRAELLYGAAKYDDPGKRTDMVEKILSLYPSLPFDDRCAGAYAEIRHSLERERAVIGPFDLQIAAVARTHNLIVVTGNVREFGRVHGLKVENWLIGGA